MAEARKVDFNHLMQSVQHYTVYTQSVNTGLQGNTGDGLSYAQATLSSDIETKFFDDFDEKSDLDEATNKRNMRWKEMSISVDVIEGLLSVLSQVKDSGLLADLSEEEGKLQEALFEIISSELSYKKSLQALVETEINQIEVKFGIKKGTREHTHLFSNIRKVYDICVKLCNIWESLWCEDILLDMNKVCKNLSDYFEMEEHRMVYILYYRNVVYQQRMVVKLCEEDEEFKAYSRNIGENNLPLSDSFLALPFQRVPRYRILLEAVIKHLPGDDMSDPEYAPIQQSLDTMLTFVAQCNNAVKKMADLEYMIDLTARLDFGSIKTVALISEKRESLRHDEVKRILKHPGMLQKAFAGTIQTWEMHLFSDLFLMGQIKKGNTLSVKGYCHPSEVCAQVIQQERAEEMVEYKLPSGCDHLIKVSFFPSGNSSVGFDKEWYLLACPTSDSQIRWIQSLTPQVGVKDSELGLLTTFEKADAPIVQVVYAYVANHADELTIYPGEVLRLMKKLDDSDWWEGEKLNNNEYGWFPGNYTVEITDRKKRMHVLLQQNKVLQMTTHFHLTHPNLKDTMYSLKDMETLVE